MRYERPKITEAQYLEANRLHREGFLPVSTKYRRAKAPPALPPEEELLALLRKVDPEQYEDIKRTIGYAIARAIGDREVYLDQGTYLALKTLEREALQGRLASHPKIDDSRVYDKRTIEVRCKDAPTVSREILDLAPEQERGVLTAIAMEELARFPGAPLSARDTLESALAFLKTRGIEVVLLTHEEDRSRRQRIYFGPDEPEEDSAPSDEDS